MSDKIPMTQEMERWTKENGIAFAALISATLADNPNAEVIFRGLLGNELNQTTLLKVVYMKGLVSGALGARAVLCTVRESLAAEKAKDAEHLDKAKEN